MVRGMESGITSERKGAQSPIRPISNKSDEIRSHSYLLSFIYCRDDMFLPRLIVLAHRALVPQSPAKTPSSPPVGKGSTGSSGCRRYFFNESALFGIVDDWHVS